MEIRKILTGRDSTASQVYFAVLNIQAGVLGVSLILSVLLGMGVRFAIKGGGLNGFMFSLLWFLMSFIMFSLVGMFLVGHVISLGDDVRKGRDRSGRYADEFYAQKMMRYVENATEHRARGGKLMGYMIGDRYMSVEQIANALRNEGGVGGAK